MKSLRHRPTLDGLIARGEVVNVRLPERPYTDLADDARVRHYSQMSPDTWRDLELKLAIARRYHDEVKLAAMRGERTLGAQMVSQGHGGRGRRGTPWTSSMRWFPGSMPP